MISNHFKYTYHKNQIFNQLIIDCLILGTVSFTSCEQKKKSHTNQHPNIVLILADDLGYNDVSAYRKLYHDRQSENPPTSLTPNIDKLAKEGMLFTDFYCGAAVCSPSRASLLTGRNCTRLGIYNWVPENQPMHLRSEEITLAELLKTKNYKTGHFGKWHLTSQNMNQPLPNDQGYDNSFFAYNNAMPSHRDPVNYFRNGQAVGPLDGYSCGLVVDEAIGWLNATGTNKAPFYINIWFNEAHSIVATPSELASKHRYNNEYYGCIENLDIAIGKLMAYLKEKNLEENTIVIFTSDNGSVIDSSNDPFRGVKHFNYEGGVRVPFVIKWPEQIPAGSKTKMPCSFTDVFPTIAALTGAKTTTGKKNDGIDISEILKGKQKTIERKNPIFFFRYFHDPICMLREDNWCLLGYKNSVSRSETLDVKKLANVDTWNFNENHMEYLKKATPEIFELYNLSSDIEQKYDVSAQHPEIVKRMKERMLAYRDEMINEGGDWYN
jgi:arylsulfatase A